MTPTSQALASETKTEETSLVARQSRLGLPGRGRRPSRAGAQAFQGRGRRPSRAGGAGLPGQGAQAFQGRGAGLPGQALHAFQGRGTGLIPGWGAQIPHATWHGQKISH